MGCLRTGRLVAKRRDEGHEPLDSPIGDEIGAT